MINFAYFICPNGQGHLRRSAIIIKCLIKLIKNINIVIICSRSHINNNNIQLLAKSNSNIYIVEYYLGHPSYTDEYSFDRLEELNRITLSCNYLISDNLIYPLMNERVKAANKLLISQFTWNQEISNRKYNSMQARMVEQEVEYINNKSIKVMGCKEFSMNNIKELKNYSAISMIAPEKAEYNAIASHNAGSRDILLFTDGTTQSSNIYIKEQLKEFMKSEVPYELRVYASPRLIDPNLEKKGVKVFNYTESEFCRIAVGICRPGLGILTELIYYGAAVIPAHKEENAEMIHNSIVINRLQNNSEITETKIPTKIALALSMLDKKQWPINYKVNFGGESQVVKHVINQIMKEK